MSLTFQELREVPLPLRYVQDLPILSARKCLRYAACSLGPPCFARVAAVIVLLIPVPIENYIRMLRGMPTGRTSLVHHE